jgi:putative NIF3 family GTP cyclohydrolase 1 type 2
MTIQQAVDRITSSFKGKAGAHTVDTIKSGDPSQPVRAIVVTFMATRDVLAQAVARGANLVITHEPTFYNHLDEEKWLANDPIYASKRKFIDQHGLAIWRSHDLPHIDQPDMIVTGMERELGWEKNQVPGSPHSYLLAPLTLEQLAQYCKDKLGIKTVRYAGDPGMTCIRVSLRVGAGGGRGAIDDLMAGADVVLAGESPEWETCEYVRDSTAAGARKALIVLGHANSEEAGMKWMSEWIAGLLPEVPVTHLSAGDPFRFI